MKSKGIGIISSDFRRLFTSRNFYFSIFAVAVVCFISVLGEINYRLSVYYLVNARHGLGAFLIAMTAVSALPFSLSYREDLKQGYIYSVFARSRVGVYCISKVIVTATGTFLTIFLGYMLYYGILSTFLAQILPNELDTILSNMAAGEFEPAHTLLAGGRYILYFIVTFFHEAIGYAFIAVFVLTISVKIENTFVLVFSAVIFYYGWFNLTYLLKLPAVLAWTYILQNGGYFRANAASPLQMVLGILLYFSIVIILLGTVFGIGVRRNVKNG